MKTCESGNVVQADAAPDYDAPPTPDAGMLPDAAIPDAALPDATPDPDAP